MFKLIFSSLYWFCKYEAWFVRGEPHYPAIILYSLSLTYLVGGFLLIFGGVCKIDVSLVFSGWPIFHKVDFFFDDAWMFIVILCVCFIYFLVGNKWKSMVVDPFVYKLAGFEIHPKFVLVVYVLFLLVWSAGAGYYYQFSVLS